MLRFAFSGGLTSKRPTDKAVPDGWESCTIESISESISSGFACSRSYQVENGHVHLRTHNISTLGMLNFDLLVRIDPKMVNPKKASIRMGDILFNNTNSQELVGKTCLVDRDYDYGFSNHITRIRLKDDIVPGFVVWYLTLLRNSGYFARICTRWINQAAVNTDRLKEQTIPLPPLTEQKRIVAKVDELMALCDQLRAQQQEQETRHAALARALLARFADVPSTANLNLLFHPSYPIPPADLRKSILTLAVKGKLAPQDPNEEPTEASVEQVSKDAKKAIRDEIIQRHGLEETPDDSDLSELPFGWRWTRLVEVTCPVPYAIKRGPFGSTIRKDMFVPTGFKVYEQQHAISGDFTSVRYNINEAKFEELSAFELYPGEILVSCSGTVGKVAIVPANIERGIINQALLKLSLHQSALLNEYFLILFPAFFMETDTLTNLSGTAQKNIPGMKILKAMPFPLPPLNEQRRIVAKVDQLIALVDNLETQLATYRATAANLISALVAELTTKD
jgi:type I restriction enzyme S subunit